MTARRSFMRALAAFDPNGWSLARGIRGALSCCVPLLASKWYGNPELSWAAFMARPSVAADFHAVPQIDLLRSVLGIGGGA